MTDKKKENPPKADKLKKKYQPPSVKKYDKLHRIALGS